MNVIFSSMNENKKPPVKPTAPVPPRRSILSQGSLPGRSERSHFMASQSAVLSDLCEELSFLRDADESHGDDEGNTRFIRQTDNTLLSLVTRRLYDVEAKLASYKPHLQDLRREIAVKDNKIQLLVQKLRAKEKMLDGGAACPGANSARITVDKAEYQGLQDKCANLKKTVQEMNRFFSDYGVTWVGDSGCQRKVQDKFNIDFRRLLASIDELNLFVREGESQMVYTNQGAAFKMPESVPLTLFSNGLMLFSGPFRDYEDPATREFVKDILDGFFPSELQRSYPDGVPFKVIDKHNATYQDPKSRLKVFGGTGQRLGHISSLTTNADEAANRPTPRRCQEMAQDKRVGVRVEDVSEDAKRPSQTPMRDSPGRSQRDRKPSEELASVPVKKSSALTNIVDKTPRTVEDTCTAVTFEKSAETSVGAGPSSPRRTAGNHPRPSCAGADVSDRKSIERHFASSSTITPESLERRDFRDLPQILKERFERLPGTGVGRCETMAVPKRTGVEEFLEKLPPVVVRDGKLVDVRGSVANIVQTPKQPGPSYHTIKFDDNHPRIQLKIRSVDGEKIYLVYISPHRTIADLRVGLDEMTRINGGQPTKYTILNASNPSKVIGLSNNQLTLQHLGIAHNTVLFLQNSTSPSPRDGLVPKITVTQK